MLVFQALLAGLGEDDEDDLETDFRNWLTDNFNDTLSEFIAKGPARLLPIGDIAGRTSQSTIWWHPQNKQLEGRDQYNAFANALMGPIGSQISGMFVAAKMYNDGEYQRMMESMLPRALSNAIAAERMGSEGVRNLKGDKLIDRDLSYNEELQKLIGFNPSVIAEVYDANSAITKHLDKISMKKSHLVNRYISAEPGERKELMQGDIAEFNEIVTPQERITIHSLLKAMRSRKAADKHTKHGLYLGKKQEYMRDIGRFGYNED
jgi:hypothetical protein